MDGNHGERDILRSCYERSLALSAKLQCASIAFPLIASGVYGFPKEEALSIALAEIGKFLLTHEMKVILVVFDRKALALSKDLIGDIDQYIDEHAAEELEKTEYGGNGLPELRRRAIRRDEERRAQLRLQSGTQAKSDNASSASWDIPAAESKSLDEVLGEAGETFQQRLFKLIDASGKDDVTVYKNANIDRKVFSRIRCKPDYRPKKKTALAFAIALHLDMPTTLDLLARAEYTFSPSSKFDLIVSYFINRKIYDINEINTVLFNYGQPTLGE